MKPFQKKRQKTFLLGLNSDKVHKIFLEQTRLDFMESGRDQRRRESEFIVSDISGEIFGRYPQTSNFKTTNAVPASIHKRQ